MAPNIPRQIIFNEVTPTGLATDLIHLYEYINNFTKGWGLKDVPINPSKCQGIVIGMSRDFPCKDGLNGASAFKKVANFASYFISERPIPNGFDKALIGDDLAKVDNHQNAMVALSFCIDAMHGAEIHRNDGVKILENRINLSKHSYVDIVDALSWATPVTHFRMISVLFEQMAYKTNPTCQYNDLVSIATKAARL